MSDELFDKGFEAGDAELTEDILEMNESEENMDIDFSSPENDDCAPEVEILTSIKKTDSELVKSVEDSILDLIRDGQSLFLFEIVESKGSGLVSPEVAEQFTKDYLKAVAINPAISWYCKLLKVMPDKFGVDGDSLFLKIPPSKFKSLISPFMNDFAGGEYSSPMVNLIGDLNNQMNGNDEARISDEIEQRKTDNEFGPDDLNSGALEFDEVHDLVDPLEDQSRMHLDDAGPFQNTQITDVSADSKICMTDLANKTIAEHFHGAGMDERGLRDHLNGERFQKNRINEIAGIFKYMNLNKGLQSKSSIATESLGNTEFDMEL